MSDQENCLLTDEEDIWIFCLEKSLKKSKIYVFCQCTYARVGRIIGATSENETQSGFLSHLFN